MASLTHRGRIGVEYVIAAYSFIFLVLIGYIWSLLRRQRALRREIDALRRTRSGPPDQHAGN